MHIRSNFRPTEYSTLGEAIRHFRLKNEWTQAKLAEKSGCGQGTIAAYESGRIIPSIKKLKAISEALNMPVSYFVDHRLSLV